MSYYKNNISLPLVTNILLAGGRGARRKPAARPPPSRQAAGTSTPAHQIKSKRGSKSAPRPRAGRAATTIMSDDTVSVKQTDCCLSKQTNSGKQSSQPTAGRQCVVLAGRAVMISMRVRTCAVAGPAAASVTFFFKPVKIFLKKLKKICRQLSTTKPG